MLLLPWGAFLRMEQDSRVGACARGLCERDSHLPRFSRAEHVPERWPLGPPALGSPPPKESAFILLHVRW